MEGALDSHLGEQHWSAVFGSINQHLDRQPAFPRVTVYLGQRPDIVGRARSVRAGGEFGNGTG
jgi:hypothetical protein